MRLVVKGCVIHLGKMYILPFSGRCRQIKIVGETIYYLQKHGSHKGWHKLSEGIQNAYKEFMLEIEKTIVGELK